MSCSITTLLSNGKDFQKLSEQEQQIAIAQLLCDISRGGPISIIVYSDGTAVGPGGVIDTTGTTTSGIQEALNSMFQLSSVVATTSAGGGKIILGRGVYSCSTKITIPSRWPFDLHITGVGKVATQLKFTGTGDFITNEDIDGSYTLPSMQLVLENIGFFYVQDTQQAAIVRLKQINELYCFNCIFAPYQMLKFPGIGMGLGYFPGYPLNAVGIVGFQIDSGINATLFVHSAFYGCAVGINAISDHVYMDHCFVGNCGTHAPGTTAGNVYSTPNPLASGFGIRLQGSDNAISNTLFHHNNVGVANYNDGIMSLKNLFFEANNFDIVADSSAGGQMFLEDLNFSGVPLVTGTWNSGTGALTVAAALGLIRQYNGIGSGDLQQLLYNNVVISSTTIHGMKLRSLTKAARDALFGPAAGLTIFQTDALNKGIRIYDGANWVTALGVND